MSEEIQVLDVVALIKDLPEKKLRKGQVGTVVESLGRGTFEVEFSDPEGQAYALAAVKRTQIMVLHYQKIAV